PTAAPGTSRPRRRTARGARAAPRGALRPSRSPSLQSFLKTRGGPLRSLLENRFRKRLERRDVRSLQALVALHDFERDALTLGQRLVALTGDGGEVDEHVRFPVAALDEAVALFVREPLDRAFCHCLLLLAEMTTSPPDRRSARNTSSSRGICKVFSPVARAADRVLEQTGDRHRADAPRHGRHRGGDLHRAR